MKYEESVEWGGDKWSKPHVATLSLHSLFELRSCLMHAMPLFDLEVDYIEDIVGKSETDPPSAYTIDCIQKKGE